MCENLVLHLLQGLRVVSKPTLLQRLDTKLDLLLQLVQDVAGTASSLQAKDLSEAEGSWPKDCAAISATTPARHSRKAPQGPNTTDFCKAATAPKGQAVLQILPTRRRLLQIFVRALPTALNKEIRSQVFVRALPKAPNKQVVVQVFVRALP